MLPTHDTSDVPEARAMIIFLGHLFARLKESSNQIRAAIKIQRLARLQMFRIVRHNSARLIQRRIATYIQQRKYGIIIREWRAYKSCTGPCLSQSHGDSCSLNSDEDSFDWEEEMARELERDGGPGVPVARNELFSTHADLNSECEISFFEDDSERNLADSEVLRLVEVEDIEVEDSSAGGDNGEDKSSEEEDKYDGDDVHREVDFSIDNLYLANENDNSCSDDGNSSLRGVSVKLQYCSFTDLDEVKSTEIISHFLLDRLPRNLVLKLSRGFRRLQVWLAASNVCHAIERKKI